MILAGMVRVDGCVVDKQAKLISHGADIQIVHRLSQYVSRGGDKLGPALDRFHVDPMGKIAMDVGCSTGGFTDCLLQRGAERVYAVDVGYGQFDWRLRNDPRVVLLERTNIRYLSSSSIAEPIDLAVIDVSFISLTLVLPCLMSFLGGQATIVALVKPQFEVGRGRVGRGGVVRDEELREEVMRKISEYAHTLGLIVVDKMDSPIFGRKGNREALMVFHRRKHA